MDTETQRVDVPIEGAIPIRAAAYSGTQDVLGAELINQIEMHLFNTLSEDEVPGRVEWDDPAQLFLWRADQPLDSSTTYRLEYRFSNDHIADWLPPVTGQMVIQTRSGPLEKLATPENIKVKLTQWADAKTVCCEPKDECYDSCGSVCQTCWQESYSYLPSLETGFQLSTFRHELVVFRIKVFSDSGPPKTRTTRYFDHEPRTEFRWAEHFEQEQAEYCVQLEVERRIDGALIQSEKVCAAPADLRPIDRLSPDFSKVANCRELPQGYDKNGPIQPTTLSKNEKQAGCGCSSVAPHTNDLSAWLVITLLGCLFGAGRRRRRRNWRAPR